MRLEALTGRLDQVHKVVSDDQDNLLANQKVNTAQARAVAPKLKLALDRDAGDYFNLMTQFKDTIARLKDLMTDVPCAQ